jgi:hypothetical protein
MGSMFGVSLETTRISAFLDKPKLLGFVENIPMVLPFALISMPNALETFVE